MLYNYVKKKKQSKKICSIKLFFVNLLQNYSVYLLHCNRVESIILFKKDCFFLFYFASAIATSRLRVFSLSRPEGIAEQTSIRNVGIYEIVSASWAWSDPLSGRGPEARKRFTVVSLCERAATELSGTLFYANRLSFFLVSRRSLSRRAAEEESTLTPRVTFITISQMQSVPGN